jgi:hypothetical protein
MRSTLLAAAALLVFAGQGLADEPAPAPSISPPASSPSPQPAGPAPTPWIKTGSIEPEPAPASAAAPPPLPQPVLLLPTDGWVDADAPPEVWGPCGPETVKPDGTVTRTARGEVAAGIGTGGYSNLRLTVCRPIGRKTWSKTTVDQTQSRSSR